VIDFFSNLPYHDPMHKRKTTMPRNAEFKLRIPRSLLNRVEEYLEKDPRCLSKNTWLLILINNALDNNMNKFDSTL